MARRSGKGRARVPRDRAATPYQRARDAGRQALSDAVLHAAGELLLLEGAGALTMRRIADHIGASTTVLYSLFDGKNGIIDAMVQVGHETLRARLLGIPESPDALASLAATSRVYRAAALEDPARYQLMFGNAIPGYQPSEGARQAAKASFDALASAVRDAVEAGVLSKSADPEFVSEVLIAAAHGAVSLELSSHFDDGERADERYAAVTAASIQPFLAKPPSRNRATAPRAARTPASRRRRGT
jgi:AcrR family transcriptional regulator